MGRGVGNQTIVLGGQTEHGYVHIGEGSAGVANPPRIRNLERRNGAEWTGSIDNRGRRGRRYGCGLQTNVLHRMSPTRPGGAVAAIETAIGPEKDSPSNT